MFKILSRNRDYSGISAGVKFDKGVGYTDNPRAIRWFKEHGYKIEVEENKEIENEKEINYTSLSYQDLKKIAAKKNINSFKVKKNELIEKLENLK